MVEMVINVAWSDLPTGARTRSTLTSLRNVNVVNCKFPSVIPISHMLTGAAHRPSGFYNYTVILAEQRLWLYL